MPNLDTVTAIGYGSTSLDQSGVMPFNAPDKGKPPEPSNKLPSGAAKRDNVNGFYLRTVYVTYI